VANQAIRGGIPPTLEKKGRKRSKKGAPASSSQPAPSPTKPIWVQDRIPTKARTIHVAGEPILPPELLKTLTGDMRSLHVSVLTVEKHLLGMTSPTYPVFVAKVPKGMGFVDKSPGDVFFLRFDDIFDMYHLKRLHPTLVRLVALSLAYQVMKEETPAIAIMDPYYMLESNLRTTQDRVIVTQYIEDFLVANKKKEIILLPYFPE
jgi:hypothetical protein